MGGDDVGWDRESATPDGADRREPPRARGRYTAVDVGYPTSGGALAALVLAADVRFTEVVLERTTTLEQVAEYRPGHFAERELPALLAVLALVETPDVVLVDGYVQLDGTGRPGLGAHLHEATGLRVVGVAKTRFRTATHAVEVMRGTASTPLFVTAAGMGADDAAALVRRMAGPFRLPDALRRVDALSRGAVPAVG